jgi:hypothetical protein
MITYYSANSENYSGEYATSNCGGYRTIWEIEFDDDGVTKDTLLIANATNADCERLGAVSLRWIADLGPRG